MLVSFQVDFCCYASDKESHLKAWLDKLDTRLWLPSESGKLSDLDASVDYYNLEDSHRTANEVEIDFTLNVEGEFDPSYAMPSDVTDEIENAIEEVDWANLDLLKSPKIKEIKGFELELVEPNLHSLWWGEVD